MIAIRRVACGGLPPVAEKPSAIMYTTLCTTMRRGFEGLDEGAVVPAEIIALMYHYRWTIEIFFRLTMTALKLI